MIFFSLFILYLADPPLKPAFNAVICVIFPPKRVASSTFSPLPTTTQGATQEVPFIYQPITLPNEFRILVVEPGSLPDEVHCRIINVVKSWRTKYDALSYAWGDEHPTETIIVNGSRTSVRKNLHSALVNLRHPNRPRRLWVDALCINQADNEERADQVQKMSWIYSTAQNVVIWLGEQTSDVRGAFSVLESFDRMCNTLLYDNEEIYSLNWSPVFHLLRRPWFQRTWIIQEAVLAQTPVLACGLDTMPWKVLSDHAFRLRAIVPDDPPLHQALSAVDMINHGRRELHRKYKDQGRKKGTYVPDFRLLSTLYEIRGFQCGDKRDKVFGILSMVTNVGPEDKVLSPNYQVSVEDLYKAVAQWDIEKNASLEILSYCSGRKRAHPNLPSWVPDFSDLDEAKPIFIIQRLRANRGSNKGLENGNRPFFLQEDGKTVLLLSGKLVDSIAEVGPLIEHPQMAPFTGFETMIRDTDVVSLDEAAVLKRQTWLSECVRIASAADPDPPRKPESMPGFWRSPTFGMSPLQFSKFHKAMIIRSYTEKDTSLYNYADFLYRDIDSNHERHIRWSERDRISLDKTYRDRLHKRRFCATRTGRLGWVPGSAMKGDLVCLFSGAQVPIILRRVLVGEQDRFMVVGDAYIGELMPPPKTPQSLWEDLFGPTWPDVYTGGERLVLV
ncbi:hypothetical protein MFIFM68171_08665 [Madurella fahalii]|uniref:Heterokaryon incompatibility domain-containing protein n=1 Tax=Madurella fahalii TaxID=1157608 RepID=A0ABQ0GL22_9PEZI